jgi:DNA repair exonuclease SbcCD ATPase subunit
MRLKSVNLRGITGLKRGMKTDDVQLDFEALNLHGIVGITGANGMGKSTFLECLQPFRTLPSRKITFKDAVCQRDSWKDLTFEMAGKTVRVMVTASSESDKTDGYMWIDGEPVTPNGKVTELDEQLQILMGSEDLFFTSQFAAQSAESLLSKSKARRKDFFVEFLRLGRYQEFSENAKQVAQYIGGILEGWKPGLDVLRGKVDQRETVEELLRARRLNLETVERHRIENKAKSEAAGLRLAAAEGALEVQEEIRRGIRYLQQAQGELTADYERRQAQHRAQLKQVQDHETALAVWLVDNRGKLRVAEETPAYVAPDRSEQIAQCIALESRSSALHWNHGRPSRAC